jgi:hypothetical protein
MSFVFRIAVVYATAVAMPDDENLGQHTQLSDVEGF